MGYCGQVFIQINIWNTNAGVTFAQAKASGLTNAWAQSAILTVGPPLGGYCSINPFTPPTLFGLTSLRLNGPYQPPKLVMTISGGEMQLSWPLGLGNFAVEQNLDLRTTNWTVLAIPPSVTYSTNYITIPVPATPSFFRLIPQ